MLSRELFDFDSTNTFEFEFVFYIEIETKNIYNYVSCKRIFYCVFRQRCGLFLKEHLCFFIIKDVKIYG